MSTSPQSDDGGGGANTRARRVKRTSNACTNCNERKVKCNGRQPCATCVRRKTECTFANVGERKLVPVKYLQELERKAAAYDAWIAPQRSKNSSRHRESHATTPDVERGRGSARNFDEDRFQIPPLHNPLAGAISEFVVDVHGRRRFLGPSSTWAYSKQVMCMIRDALPHNPPEVPMHFDGRSLEADWPCEKTIGPLSMAQLPSLETAHYLIDVVKFHLGQMYHLLDEQVFIGTLHEVYEGGLAEPLHDHRLWYIHFLLVIALGQAILAGCENRRPAGSIFFSRAIDLVPDSLGLYQDPLESIELLCCLALYLQSLDFRNSAYVYIGSAMRIALTQGLHREGLATEADRSLAMRRQSLWWSVYILDRRFSSLLGVPNSVNDKDITVELPGSEPRRSLRLHVTLSRLSAQILNSVYGRDACFGTSFLPNLRRILHNLAAMAPELNEGFEFSFGGPTARTSATLNLYYHQCIVLATRPLQMCLLRTWLEDMKARRPCSEVAEPVKVLLKTSQESAVQSLRILKALQAQHLLECFLPFDLESVFSCAFVLSLMTLLPWSPSQDVLEIDMSFGLLNTMVNRGNTVAQFRKEELEKLVEFLQLARTESCDAPAVDDLQAATIDVLSAEQMLNLADLLSWDTNLVDTEAQWLWAEPSGL